MSSDMSDERREVARRLREYPVHLAPGMEGGSPLRALAMLSGLLDATGLRQDEPARLYGRLADLIDPTCEMEVSEVTHRPTLDALDCGMQAYVCDSCHIPSYLSDVCCLPQPRYCPNCGRRIVDGGGEDA